MPMTITKATSPKGHPYARIVSSGDVTPEDAEAGGKQWGPGGPYENMAMLALVEPGAKFSPEARQVFTKSSGGEQQSKPVAVVVTSAPLRVMLSFIIRASGAAGMTRFFGTEAEAIAYIDEKLS